MKSIFSCMNNDCVHETTESYQTIKEYLKQIKNWFGIANIMSMNNEKEMLQPFDPNDNTCAKYDESDCYEDEHEKCTWWKTRQCVKSEYISNFHVTETRVSGRNKTEFILIQSEVIDIDIYNNQLEPEKNTIRVNVYLNGTDIYICFPWGGIVPYSSKSWKNVNTLAMDMINNYKNNYRIFVCGHSMGGNFALSLAMHLFRKDRGLFDSILFICSGCIPMVPKPMHSSFSNLKNVLVFYLRDQDDNEIDSYYYWKLPTRNFFTKTTNKYFYKRYSPSYVINMITDTSSDDFSFTFKITNGLTEKTKSTSNEFLHDVKMYQSAVLDDSFGIDM
jgi:hypothetical protein